MPLTVRALATRLKTLRPRTAMAALRYCRRNGIRAALRHIGQGTPSRVDPRYSEWIERQEPSLSVAPQPWPSQTMPDLTISVLVPVYNAEPRWLRACIDSVFAQSYPHWELCLADDHSSDPGMREILEGYAAKDSRVKVVFRPENGHISRATNSALELATGQFVALLDNDDELAPHALAEIATVLKEHPDADLIYSDEDKIDPGGHRSDPAFKPDWSPDLLLGTNYISHLGVYRRSLVEQIGGFRSGFEGSQDYDLVLRFTEQTSPSKIIHIPQVLYHWRMTPTSTASDPSSKKYAFDNGLKAVKEALARRGLTAIADHGAGSGLYDVRYHIQARELVSIIIPTRDGYEDTRRCLRSIIAKTTYKNYEIILADNGSTDPRMEKLYEQMSKKLGTRFTKVNIDIPFNFSRINNLAARHAHGKYYLFLNNDTEVITPGWLTVMVSFAQFDRVGMVGATLSYPTGEIQHAGVVLGLGGVAGHPHHMYQASEHGYFGRLQVNVNYYALTAACVMIKKADLDAVGGFDEDFQIAYNDVDLAIRVHDLGRDNIFAHNARLYHHESRTRGYDISPEKAERLSKEAALLYSRYPAIIDRDPYYNPNLSKQSGSFRVNLDTP